MSRMETQALTAVIEEREAGGYTLPTDLLDAWRTYQRIKEASVELPPVVDGDVAAARLVAAAAAGEEIDAAAQARALAEQIASRANADQARLILARAVEQAAEAATMLAGDLTEQIITKHLAPAMDAVLAEAREVARAIGDHSRETHALLKAPAKVRTAYLRLPELVGRQTAILHARQRVNVLGHRVPKHDQAGLFATFEKPFEFFPRWSHPAPVPRLPFLDDPQENLLWLASDPVAQKAKPWLATTEQQDAAWWAHFGPGVEMRAQAHRNGAAVGARIGSLR